MIEVRTPFLYQHRLVLIVGYRPAHSMYWERKWSTGGVACKEVAKDNLMVKPALYKHRLVLLMIYTTADSKY